MSATAPVSSNNGANRPAATKQPTQAGSIYELKPGDNISKLVYSRMEGKPVEEIERVVSQVMKMNGVDSYQEARNLPIGMEVKLPAFLSRDTDKKIGAGSGGTSKPEAAPNQAAAPEASGGAGGRQNNPDKISVAVIDTFANQPNGFNHGREITETIQAGGADPNLAGQIDVIQYGVDGPEGLERGLAARTAAALEDVIARVQNGEDIDAVNMSLQDFNASQNADRVRQLIEQLISMNVLVAVAAGNGGANAVNQLTTPDAFVVESATGGVRNASSGLGNVSGESNSTSFATAGLTPQLAALMNSGLTVQQVRQIAGI